MSNIVSLPSANMKPAIVSKKHKRQMRWHIVGGLCLLNGYRIGAEIGVSTGRFSIFLCGLSPEFMMLCVDRWAEQPENEVLGRETYTGWNAEESYQGLKDVARKYFKGKMFLRRMDSVEAAKTVEDGSLDFVFIDADHSYEKCSEDIAAWDPKVRQGGMVCGHDYSENWPGVIRAVDELNKKVSVFPDAVWVYQK